MSEEMKQVPIDLSHVFELLSNKENDILDIDYSNDNDSYPTVRAVKNYVDVIDDKVSVVYNTVSIIDTSDSVYDADRWTEYGPMSIGQKSNYKFIGGGNSGYVIYDGNISNLDNYDITLNLQANRKNTNLYINDDDNIGTLPTSQTSILFKKRDGVVKVVYDNNQYDASAVKIVAFNIMSLIRYTIDVVLYQGMIYDVIDSIPSKTSDLTNDSGYLTTHQNISGKEDKSNKVTSLSSSSTDTEYPSAKIVYDSLQEISKNITFEATFKERTTEQVWMSAYATKLVFTCNTLTDNDLNKNFRVKLNLNSSSIQNINNMVIIVLESTNLSNDFEAKLVNRRFSDEYEMNLLNCDWIITEKTNGNYNVYSYQLNYGLSLLSSNSPYNAIVDNLTTNDATKVLSARQGKVLNDLIGDAITYINGTGGN